MGIGRYRPTQGLISSSPAMAGLPPCISSSTSYRKHSNETVDIMIEGAAMLEDVAFNELIDLGTRSI
jgi:hypothetical protein